MLLLIFFSMKPNVIKRKEGRDSIEKIRRVIVFIKFVPWVFDSCLILSNTLKDVEKHCSFPRFLFSFTYIL
jgi:hypothetical protein